jgi:Zn-dependent peptidase ImmA (M78 family)/transcriptional regulator with XRE-family HTH domain
MPTALPLPINPSVLVWAREESGYPVDRVAQRLHVKTERLVEWEEGVRQPTMKQAENLARIYHRPLTLFFRSKPPVIPALSTEYRRLSGVVPGQESPELRLALRKMSTRREIMLQLLVELGESTPAFDLIAHLSEAPATVASRLRSTLGVTPDAQRSWTSEWQAWTAWRTAAEEANILVFQFPNVPLSEARGVTLLREPLPVAAINSKEGPESRAFTLVHEIVHLMLAAGHEEVAASRETRSSEAWAEVERFAEETAAQTLVPETMLEEEIRSAGLPRNGWDVVDVRSLARRFKITPLAMATRLRASGYFGWAHYQAWRLAWDAYVATLKPRSSGFAHPVTTTLGRAGRPFTQLVLEALSLNRITIVNAAHYLDLKASHFEKLKNELTTRPGMGGIRE